EQAATFFGVASANIANLFNPELIVVGGWLGRKFGPTLLTRIAEVMRGQALDYAAAGVELALGRFGDDAVALGASTLVVAELLATGGVLPASPAARSPRAAWR
ncbi:MAG TPA: ROK family protein, partial [Solirubrobacteraceae bacterium]